MKKSPLHTPICDMFGIKYPIFLAGMGPVAMPELVAAVSNAGGLGVLGRSMPEGRKLSPDELRERIRYTRTLTDRPFGVDLVLPSGLPATDEGIKESIPKAYWDFVEKTLKKLGGRPVPPDDGPEIIDNVEFAQACAQVICEEKVPVFCSALGLPAWCVPMFQRANVKIMSLVGKTKDARTVVARGADIAIAQGYDAGGHTGKIGTFTLIPAVVDAVGDKALVLGAGGIMDGRGVAAALALGASGVWCGTAFLATNESPIPQVWKDRIVAMTDENEATLITKHITGRTTRMARHAWINEWEQSGLPPLKYPMQHLFTIEAHRVGYALQNVDILPQACGQAAPMIKAIRPASEVMREMVEEAEAILSGDVKPRIPDWARVA